MQSCQLTATMEFTIEQLIDQANGQVSSRLHVADYLHCRLVEGQFVQADCLLFFLLASAFDLASLYGMCLFSSSDQRGAGSLYACHPSLRSSSCTRCVFAFCFPVFCVVPFHVGWRPVVHGTHSHAEWPMRPFCSCVVPFCVGWRPVNNGTPTHAEWPMRLFSFFLCWRPCSTWRHCMDCVYFPGRPHSRM